MASRAGGYDRPVVRRGLTPVGDHRELAVGDKLGRYELIRKLGYGGMAEVHLARATGIEGFQKLVVVKRILPHLAQDAAFIRMFLAEARLAAMLDHHNIAQVFDLGRDEDDYYFVMEHVNGVDVRQILKASAKRGGLPYRHGVAIAVGTAAGLQYAHTCTSLDGRPLGIVHRDVSPTNVLVNYDGCVKIVDFGVAKVVTRTDVTRAGTRKGKVPYMSPEQCQTANIDARSDVFSLGILLWEVTTNRRLFRGDNEFSIMHQIVNQDAPPPSSVRDAYPPKLERIVMRALHRDRERRYQSAVELQTDLEKLAQELGWRTSPTSLSEQLHELFPDRKPALQIESVGDPGPVAGGSAVTKGTPPSVASAGSHGTTGAPIDPGDSAILEDKETLPLEVLSESDLLSEISGEGSGVGSHPGAAISNSYGEVASSPDPDSPGYRATLRSPPHLDRPPPPRETTRPESPLLALAWVATLAAAAGIAATVVTGNEAAPRNEKASTAPLPSNVDAPSPAPDETPAPANETPTAAPTPEPQAVPQPEPRPGSGAETPPAEQPEPPAEQLAEQPAEHAPAEQAEASATSKPRRGRNDPRRARRARRAKRRKRTSTPSRRTEPWSRPSRHWSSPACSECPHRPKRRSPPRHPSSSSGPRPSFETATTRALPSPCRAPTRSSPVPRPRTHGPRPRA